jgi:hypothetical protein
MRIIYEADPCEPLRAHVQATYMVRYRPEPGGKRGSVVLTLVNDWSLRVYIEYGGQAEATGLRSSPAPRTLHWGSSSADTLGSRPGRRAHEMAWPSETRTPWLHLEPAGTIRVTEFSGWVWAEDAAIDGCSIPIRPRPRS